MKQVLELELLTNIDFRGNPIKSLDEENLIFEEILDKCSNVWFINGATTLASPLIEDDKHSINGNTSINNSFELSLQSNNNNTNNNITNNIINNNDKNVNDEKLKSAEELLKKHSYIIEHLKTHKTNIPTFSNTTITNNTLINNNNSNNNITSNNSNNTTISTLTNQSTTITSTTPTTTTTTIYNDPAILKNLANFAKARSKRSDSCPTIPSPNSSKSYQQQDLNPIRDDNEDVVVQHLTHSISSNLFENISKSLEKDKNSLKLMEVKNFERQVRNRQQSRALQLEQDKFDLNQEDSFLSNYQSILSQQKKNTININNAIINTNSNTFNNLLLNKEDDEELSSPPIETVKVELPSLMEKASTITLQKLQVLIDSNTAPPTPPCKQSITPPKELITTPQNNGINSNNNSSNQQVSPTLSTTSSSSSNSSNNNTKNNYNNNNSTLNISAIPHSLNQSNISNISMNLSQINTSFFNSTPTTQATNITINSNVNSNSSNVTNRALSIKERAKQNMLKKLNM
ncbi:predicted protein [Naegleria gruberi]|uniref:Predicted protein n=1 Tax=Naegleria gruberi TaxID=5762 RepID=D2W4B9_NAEGR|nr:uncharacterized protein NAEGRDRAFT_76250 [Naegleria gruberi]EFC36090.1 predicted protein [Naegleria gruberi]|eukprot:XP_002668834.1 predicted protein [Naegleria gruberi strain NEG-M]